MAIRRTALAAGAAALLAVTGMAAAATPKQDAALAKELRPTIKAQFAAEPQAKSLVLGAVTCTIARSGKAATCRAHFTDPAAKADIVYVISATRTVKGDRVSWPWSAHSPSCSLATTHARIACD